MATSFRFRLAKVLEWYEKQCETEREKLRQATEIARMAREAIDRHQREVLARRTEVIQAKHPDANELAALGPFLLRAKKIEAHLLRNAEAAEKEIVHQRAVVQQAEIRRQLVEKLRERKMAEHQYEADKALEELAAESHLAGFARAMR